MYDQLGVNRHISKKHAVFEDESTVKLLLTHCEGGTIGSWLAGRSLISEQTVARLIKQLLCGIAYCHRRGRLSIVRKIDLTDRVLKCNCHQISQEI